MTKCYIQMNYATFSLLLILKFHGTNISFLQGTKKQKTQIKNTWPTKSAKKVILWRQYHITYELTEWTNNTGSSAFLLKTMFRNIFCIFLGVVFFNFWCKSEVLFLLEVCHHGDEIVGTFLNGGDICLHFLMFFHVFFEVRTFSSPFFVSF